MPSYQRLISIYYHAEARTSEIALPNIGGASNITATAYSEPSGPYEEFSGKFEYTPAKGHRWAGKIAEAYFDGYFDESGVLWTSSMETGLNYDLFATVTFGKGGMPLTVALDHLPRLIDALGARVDGSRSNDRITGGGASDVLLGDKGDDFLRGEGGDDILAGGAGRDRLWGGKGADLFVIHGDPLLRDGRANRDIIKDFGGSDRIDLHGVDADEADASDDRFDFIGSDRFSGTAGELRYHKGLVRGDTDGDGRSDFSIEIANGAQLDASDFIL